MICLKVLQFKWTCDGWPYHLWRSLSQLSLVQKLKKSESKKFKRWFMKPVFWRAWPLLTVFWWSPASTYWDCSCSCDGTLNFVIADDRFQPWTHVSVRAQSWTCSEVSKNWAWPISLSPHGCQLFYFISDHVAVIYRVLSLVARTEELFNNLFIRHTQSAFYLLYRFKSILERKKVLKVYDPGNMTMRQTSQNLWVEIRPGHYVWANQAETCSLQST